MSIVLNCGGCGKKLEVSESRGGTNVQCPFCDAVVPTPAAKAEPYQPEKRAQDEKVDAVAVVVGVVVLFVIVVVCAGSLEPWLVKYMVMAGALGLVGALATIFGGKK